MKQNSECLLILDSRTGISYQVPVENSYIHASDLCKIKAPVDSYIDSGNESSSGSSSPAAESTQPLKILDQGFAHTACMTSSITDV
jgi:citrate synthase